MYRTGSTAALLPRAEDPLPGPEVSCIDGMTLAFFEALLLLADNLLLLESDPGGVGNVNVAVDATTTECRSSAWSVILVFLFRRKSNGVSGDDDDLGGAW